MSRQELERAEVMGRVKSGDLPLKDAAAVLNLSYRQTKRVWRRDREGGAEGLKHGNAGRGADRGEAGELRRRGVRPNPKEKSGKEGGGLRATLAGRTLGGGE